ncbi:MAG: copper homeostasis protein CutC [Bacteroidaceae bacterium]|nr:copper homeostasis protein CutC [Bacteroidaceae bacterium]
MKPILEVCCGNWSSVCAAAEGGAERIELCAALPLGGVTPSLGLAERVKATFPHLTLHILIRAREGSFVYSPDEVTTMVSDIRRFVEAGADGIVCGALTADGYIDTLTTRRFVEAADGTPFTFHRAFDHVEDPSAALETLAALGCTRVLTSGGAPTACAGIPMLRRLVRQSAGRFIVLPGAGINAHNAARILHETGATELHASCALPVSSATAGPAPGTDDTGALLVTNAQRVSELIQAMNAATSIPDQPLLAKEEPNNTAT